MSYAFAKMAHVRALCKRKKPIEYHEHVSITLWHTTKNSTESCEMSDTSIEFLCFITTVEYFTLCESEQLEKKNLNAYMNISKNHFKWTSLDVKCNRESMMLLGNKTCSNAKTGFRVKRRRKKNFDIRCMQFNLIDIKNPFENYTHEQCGEEKKRQKYAPKLDWSACIQCSCLHQSRLHKKSIWMHWFHIFHVELFSFIYCVICCQSIDQFYCSNCALSDV